MDREWWGMARGLRTCRDGWKDEWRREYARQLCRIERHVFCVAERSLSAGEEEREKRKEKHCSLLRIPHMPCSYPYRGRYRLRGYRAARMTPEHAKAH